MKVSKLLSLEEETASRLKKEANASAVVESALQAHYSGKDAYKRLVTAVEKLEDYDRVSYRLNDIQETVKALLDMARR